MPTTEKTAPRKRGAVARSETNGKAKTIRLSTAPVKGMELIGPSTLPGTFSWDFAEMQSRIREDDAFALGTLYRLIVSLIGEEQAEQIRAKLKASSNGAGGADVMVGVLNDIIAAYGTEPGES
jgi:hypothetical protein